MGLVKRLKNPIGTARDFIFYPTIAFLPRGLQIKAFEKLPNAWPKGRADSYQLEAYVAQGNASSSEPKFVQASLEERLGFEAAVKNTTRSAAMELLLGAGVFSLGTFYPIAITLITGEGSFPIDPVVAGYTCAALSVDAMFRFASSAGHAYKRHEPAGLGQGVTLLTGIMADILLSKENYRGMWNELRGK